MAPPGKKKIIFENNHPKEFIFNRDLKRPRLEPHQRDHIRLKITLKESVNNMDQSIAYQLPCIQ